MTRPMRLGPLAGCVSLESARGGLGVVRLTKVTCSDDAIGHQEDAPFAGFVPRRQGSQRGRDILPPRHVIKSAQHFILAYWAGSRLVVRLYRSRLCRSAPTDREGAGADAGNE